MIARVPILKHPLDQSEFSEKEVSFSVLTQKFALNAAMLLSEKNTYFLAPLDFHFLYVWGNKETLAEYALKFLIGFNTEVLTQTLQYAVLYVLLTILAFVVCFGLMVLFILLTKEFDDIRGKILKLFKRIPHDTSAEIFENLFKQANQESNNNNSEFRITIPNTLIVLGCIVVIFICFSICEIAFMYQTMLVLYNDNSARDLMV